MELRIGTHLLASLGALLLMACGQSGDYFDKSPQQVIAALRSAAVPIHVLGSTVKRSRVTQIDSHTIVTALLDTNGSELMRFVSTVTPDGTGSRVATSVVAPEGRNKDRAEAAMAKNGLAMGLMAGVAKEHVASAIEGRPFDMLFANPMAQKMAGAIPGVSQQINAANEAAAEMAKYEQQAEFEKNYGEDWGGSRRREEDGWAD